MVIFALDDDPALLYQLSGAIRAACPDAAVWEFSRASAALKAVQDDGFRPDVIFLDIEMPGISGLELARRMKLLCPESNIIFVTAYSEYDVESMQLYPSGYVLKPVTTARVRQELDNLRHPVSHNSGSRVSFQCFGNFEAFIDGHPIRFHYEKTKELLAYLVDRGTLCSNAEIIAALWEGEISGSYFRTLRKELIDTFRAADCADVLLCQRGHMGIATDKVSCDYYDWKESNSWALNAYRGEYMSQYSWSEFTLGALPGTV